MIIFILGLETIIRRITAIDIAVTISILAILYREIARKIGQTVEAIPLRAVEIETLLCSLLSIFLTKKKYPIKTIAAERGICIRETLNILSKDRLLYIGLLYMVNLKLTKKNTHFYQFGQNNRQWGGIYK